MLGVWSHIEGVFNRHPSHNHRMRIIRVRTHSKRIVGRWCNQVCVDHDDVCVPGIMVPRACIDDMRQTLTRVAQQAEGTEDNPITL